LIQLFGQLKASDILAGTAKFVFSKDQNLPFNEEAVPQAVEVAKGASGS
jgi:hypothetical protein